MDDEVMAEVGPASAYYIAQVKRKQATGQYGVEPASCFCGRQAGLPIAHTDRYGFAHRMLCCPHCGVIYANPRMTAQAYAEFYQREYRQIYGADDTPEEDAVRGQLGGETILQFIHNRTEHQPQIVFDFGCHDGSYLRPFQEAGCTVYGVDLNADSVARGRARGLPLVVGGLEQLECLGVKADLILVNHVLEHCLDLEHTLVRLGDLLRPNGLLFVGVPGLYRWQPEVLIQNAHVWQFTAETLSYVMRCCGFEEVYCDQGIVSLWEYTGACDSKEAVSAGCARQILQYVQHGKRFAPEIRTMSKFSLPERKRAIDAALATGLPDVHELIGTITGRAGCIVGGGPSAELQVEQVERLKADGAVLFAIERMLPWCLSHALVPDYVVIMDASEDVVDGLHTLPSTSHYLVATQCPATVFETLRGLDVSIFNTPQRGINMESLWKKHHRNNITKINGGGSVVLCAMSLAMTLGIRHLHLIGFDCHVTHGYYAPGIAGAGEMLDGFDVSLPGSPIRYRTNSAYLSFAQQFFKLMEIARRQQLIETVQIYGDSLVRLMHKAGSPLESVIRFTQRTEAV